nr:helix-turn-helix domain-containing protein [Streptomyces sp. NRRL B-1347]
MDAVHDYEQELVQLFMAIGLQQMMSRVLACLCVTDSGSVTAADLTRRLAVSPASVSKAVGQLENQEIIRREREAGHRNDRYIIGDDILFRSIVDNCRRNAALAQTAYKGAGVLGPETPAGVRLTGLGQLLEHVSRGLLQWMEQWPQIRAAQQATHTAGHTDS